MLERGHCVNDCTYVTTNYHYSESMYVHVLSLRTSTYVRTHPTTKTRTYMKRWSLTSYRHAGLFKEVLQKCGIRLPIRTPPGLNVRFLATIRVLVECFDRHLKPFDVSLFSFCDRKSKKLKSKHIVTEAEAMRQVCCPGKRLADVRT